MQLLKQEQQIRDEIFKYFGYAEDWRVLPFQDCTEYYWQCSGERSGSVLFADSVRQLIDDDEGDRYNDEIYTNRHLDKWVYRGKEYTMILVDTHTDNNQFLSIFDNSKEVK